MSWPRPPIAGVKAIPAETLSAKSGGKWYCPAYCFIFTCLQFPRRKYRFGHCSCMRDATEDLKEKTSTYLKRQE
jgi:hypothetical protein